MARARKIKTSKSKKWSLIKYLNFLKTEGRISEDCCWMCQSKGPSPLILVLVNAVSLLPSSYGWRPLPQKWRLATRISVVLYVLVALCLWPFWKGSLKQGVCLIGVNAEPAAHIVICAHHCTLQIKLFTLNQMLSEVGLICPVLTAGEYLPYF